MFGELEGGCKNYCADPTAKLDHFAAAAVDSGKQENSKANGTKHARRLIGGWGGRKQY